MTGSLFSLVRLYLSVLDFKTLFDAEKSIIDQNISWCFL
jgi:hypothetical protein